MQQRVTVPRSAELERSIIRRSLSDRERMGRARIEHHFIQLDLEWARACSQLQAELFHSNNFGGSASVQKGVEALRVRSGPAIEAMLAEMSHAVRVRRRLWHRLHDYALELVDVYFGDVAEKVEAMMYRGTGHSGVAAREVPSIITDMRARIANHAAGWTAPPADTIPQRFPVAFPVAMALLGFGLGVAVDPVRKAISEQITAPAKNTENKGARLREGHQRLSSPR